jgi:hypothetical protein
LPLLDPNDRKINVAKEMKSGETTARKLNDVSWPSNLFARSTYSVSVNIKKSINPLKCILSEVFQAQTAQNPLIKNFLDFEDVVDYGHEGGRIQSELWEDLDVRG